MSDPAPYNPLDKTNLGASVADALLEQHPVPLGSIQERFDGAGVYAIYYTGSLGLYGALTERNVDGRFEVPIYVGKADAQGGRKGGLGLDENPGPQLHKRLKEHAKSIEQANNLNLSDFHCRYLVVEPIFVALGESLLIATYAPLWNKLVDGFGNHTPGKGRFEGMRPRWDVLHPGRPWAEKCQPREETAEQIAAEVVNFLGTTAFPTSVRMHRT